MEAKVKLSLDVSSFGSGANQAQSALGKIGKSLNKVGKGSLSVGKSAVKGFAMVGTAAVAAAGAIGGIAYKMAETAAELDAMDAQFSATFEGVEEQAKSAMESISKTTNIHGDRMTSTFTKMYSQMKGAGMSGAKAMAQTEKATMLAADAAAYYDISLEDAEKNLRSFLRGNTEAGDSLGLFTSESQRAEKANKMYGKSWKDLTEAQKQNVMLDITEEIYKQSGAMGQAQREAMNFTNVVANLGASFKRLVAVVGQPIMEALIPVIQSLSTEFDNLSVAIKEDGLAGGFDYLLERAQATIPQLPGIISGALNNVANFLSTYGMTMLTLGAQLIGNLALGILQGLPSVLGAISDLITQVADKVRNFKLDDEGLGMAKDIARGIISGIGEVVKSIVDLIVACIVMIHSNMGAMFSAGENMAGEIGKGLGSGVAYVLANLDVVLFNILNFFANAIPALVDSGIALIEGFAEGLAEGDIMSSLGDILIAVGKGLWNLTLGLAEAITKLISFVIEGLTFGVVKLPPLDLEEFKFSGEEAKTETDKIKTDVKSLENETVKTPPVDTSSITEANIRAAAEAGAIPPEMADRMIGNLPIINGATDQMASTIQAGTEKAATAGEDGWSGLSNGVDSGFTQANQAVQQGATNMYNGAKQSFSKLAEVGKQAGSDLYNGMGNSIKKLESVVKQSCSSMYNGAGNSLKQLASVGKQALSDLYNGGGNSVRQLASAVSSSMSNVRSSINSIGGAVNSAIADFNRLASALSRTITANININKRTTLSTVSGDTQAVRGLELYASPFAATDNASGFVNKPQQIIENIFQIDSDVVGRSVAEIVGRENTRIETRNNRLAGGY